MWHTVFIIPRRARSKRAKNVIRIRYRASQFIGLLRCFFCVFWHKNGHFLHSVLCLLLFICYFYIILMIKKGENVYEITNEESSCRAFVLYMFHYNGVKRFYDCKCNAIGYRIIIWSSIGNETDEQESCFCHGSCIRLCWKRKLGWASHPVNQTFTVGQDSRWLYHVWKYVSEISGKCCCGGHTGKRYRDRIWSF